jgi:hypothetical protein
MPVRAHAAPVALVIAIQGAQAVEVHTDAPVPSPSPLSAAMHAVVVVIATPQVPVAANLHPARTGPAPQDAQAVQVTANATPSAPEPARALVVVVATPQVPIRADSTPVSLVVAIQGSQPIQMNTDSPETSPHPLVSAMQMMVVVVPSVQMPVAAHIVPPSAIPSSVDPQTVQMTADPAVSAPEPAWSLIVLIAAIEVPIGADAAPMSLVVSVQCAQAIEVYADSSVPAPLPIGSAMEPMIVRILSVQVPVTSHLVPTTAIPTAQDSQAVLMPANPAVMVCPEPTRSLVIMVPAPEVPVCTNTAPVALVIAIQCSQAV